MQIYGQLSVSQQMRLCPQVPNHHEILPKIEATMGPMQVVHIGHSTPRIGAKLSSHEQRILARLPKCVETLGLLPHHRWELGLGVMILNARHGPTITRRWTQQGQDQFSAEGQTLAITFDCVRFMRQRFTFVICVVYHASSMLRPSLRLDLSLSYLVPPNNPIFQAIKVGDIDHLKRMIAIEPLAMSTVTRGGYTLLHARTHAQIRQIDF